MILFFSLVRTLIAGESKAQLTGAEAITDGNTFYIPSCPSTTYCISRNICEEKNIHDYHGDSCTFPGQV